MLGDELGISEVGVVVDLAGGFSVVEPALEGLLADGAEQRVFQFEEGCVVSAVIGSGFE